PLDEAPALLGTLIEERKRLERELADARRKLAMGGGDGASQPVSDVAGVKLFSRAVSGVDAKDLKSLVDDAKKVIGTGVVAIANASADGKAGIVVGVTDDLVAKFNAVDFVRVASEKLGGKGGGGRPDLAQAGGPDAHAIDAALAAIQEALRAKANQ
ncbi:MAG: DHHA1 domain-containing protein, partial [Methylocystis sp.]